MLRLSKTHHSHRNRIHFDRVKVVIDPRLLEVPSRAVFPIFDDDHS